MKKGYLAALIILTVLTLASLATNAAVIYGIMRWQRIAATTMSRARTALAGIGNETFTYTFKLDKEFPIKTSVPFQDEFTVPVSMTIPINENFSMPIDVLGFTFNVNVPINMEFPFQGEFTVPISMTMDVDMTVPISMEIPVEISLGDTPLAGRLNETDAIIGDLESQMADPLGWQELKARMWPKR